MSKIPVGISSCLVGENVRYDGGHKKNDFIVDTLGKIFAFQHFCPETNSGMGIPRPPIQLRRIGDQIRCVAVKDHSRDFTDVLQHSFAPQLEWLSGLSAYILKKDSPSCGMERVKVYEGDVPRRQGTGVFAQFIQQHLPLLPLEEEGRLGNPALRENFVQRVIIYHRWRQLERDGLSAHVLTTFHSQHKLILMSHHPLTAKELGQIAASATPSTLDQVSARYAELMMDCLRKLATRGNHANVLQHIQGYLKRTLASDDKQELSELIESYRQGFVPLIVPIALLRHHFRKQPDPFIQRSYYLNRYADEMPLLNET